MGLKLIYFSDSAIHKVILVNTKILYYEIFNNVVYITILSLVRRYFLVNKNVYPNWMKLKRDDKLRYKKCVDSMIFEITEPFKLYKLQKCPYTYI